MEWFHSRLSVISAVAILLGIVSCDNARKPTQPSYVRVPGYHIYTVDLAKSYISEVLRFDTYTKVIDTIPIPSLYNDDYSIEVSPFDDILFFGNNSVLIAFDLRTNSVKATRLVPARSLAVSPDGRHIAAWGGTRLNLMSAGDLSVTKYLDCSLVLDPRFSHDSRFLTFQARSAQVNESLYVAQVNVEEGTETRHLKGSLHQQVIFDPTVSQWYVYRYATSFYGVVSVFDEYEQNLLTLLTSPSHGFLAKPNNQARLYFTSPGGLTSIDPPREQLFYVDSPDWLLDSISTQAIITGCQTQPGYSPERLSVSRDDSMMVISEIYSNRYLVMNLATQICTDTVQFQFCEAMILSGAAISFRYDNR